MFTISWPIFRIEKKMKKTVIVVSALAFAWPALAISIGLPRFCRAAEADAITIARAAAGRAIQPVIIAEEAADGNYGNDHFGLSAVHFVVHREVAEADLPAPTQDASNGEINVALQAMGSSAQASSFYGPGYEANRAIDGRWEVRETDKWNSAQGPGPHWLEIDFGRSWMIHKVVIRHEGVYDEGDRYNTRDFQIQRGEACDGPWTNLVPPVTGNRQDVTTHLFAPTAVRFLRLFINQGEQNANEYGRIFEIEAYADAADVPPELRSKYATLRAQANSRDFPSCFSDGSLRIVSSSHQDTAWMDTPDACRRFRIEHNILPALEMMRKDPRYTFCMEGALHLMEFLEAHPELRDEVMLRMKEGRLEFGATYNEPYESWLSGEELARETYFGRRWIQKNLPGCDAKVAFNPDPPGRSLQTGQILARAGIRYMFISRYHEGLYRWLSPDGSGVLAYTPGHYGNHLPLLNATPARCVSAIAAKLEQQAPYYEERHIPPVYCLINTMDFSAPHDFTPLINLWNSQPAAASGVAPPRMQYSSIRAFFEAIDKPVARFDTLVGERPDVWVYITGPTHHWMDSAKRQAARLLPAAETFTTMSCLLKGGFRDWPSNELNAAWLDEIYVDHGIGGNNGHISDEIFYRKVKSARDTAGALLDKALANIAAQVKTDVRAGTPVIVFNDLSWKRSDAVEMILPATMTGPVVVTDRAGHEVPSQFTSLGLPDEADVAAAALGARATANSALSPEYGPGNAINGRWAVRDPDPALGGSDEWRSASNAVAPRWLAIDFGQPRTIHKVVLRHDGSMGVFHDETRNNTSDFEIQGADSAEGPWTDLVAPVVGNRASLTTHLFAPQTMRFLRLLIHRGSQPEGDLGARIYEVQAFASEPARTRKLIFVANDVPPLGYKTYYLVARAGRNTAPPAVGGNGCENSFYRVTLAPGGIGAIYDKQLKRELLTTGKFLGGEVFTMLSVAPNNRRLGTDAGEFGAIPLPVMDASFDRVANHNPRWSLLENGPVRAVYGLEQPLSNTTVRQRVLVWHQIKRIDCEVDLAGFNGELWREFRMALPLAMDRPTIVYQVPMATVEIGKDEIPTTGGHAYGSLNYFQLCRDIHPRQVQDFVDASDAQGGLTMSSSVSVFDWIDPTAGTPGNPLLQPVLLASRKSCNGSGVWYPQAGNHFYRFPITSHAGGWRNGWKDGIAANHPLIPTLARAVSGAALPPELSFASVSADNVVVSTIKKAEDDDSVVLRLYDLEGKDSPVSVHLFRPVKSAEKTSLIEEDPRAASVSKGSLQFQMGHHAIETYQLHL